jgi:hypothetical protein
MSRMKRSKALLTVILVLAGAAAANAAGPVDIYNGGDLHESIGQADGKNLQRGVTYTASTFPIAIRVRTPDALWGGAQFQSGRFRFLQLTHLRAGSRPLHGVGYITLESAKGSTPSAATAIKQLHATPLIKAGPIRPIHVAGFTGRQFDATVVGIDRTRYSPSGAGGISLTPFMTNRHCGFCTKTMQGETQDAKFAGEGQLFRIIALDVRGKTVVIYLESTYAIQPKYPPTQTYPTFLPYAQQMLSKTRFGS